MERAAVGRGEIAENRKRSHPAIENPWDEETTKQTGTLEIYYGNATNVCPRVLKPKSVDLIVTDPMYKAKCIQDVRILRDIALRFLKPDGLLIALYTSAHLKEWFQLTDPLKSMETLAVLMPGSLRVRNFHLAHEWKPFLVMANEGYTNAQYNKRIRMHSTLLLSAGRIKRKGYAYQQPVENFVQVLKPFLRRNDTILDPFAGSGTTAVALRRLGHRGRVVMVDKSKEAVSIMRRRLLVD